MRNPEYKIGDPDKSIIFPSPHNLVLNSLKSYARIILLLGVLNKIYRMNIFIEKIIIKSIIHIGSFIYVNLLLILTLIILDLLFFR